MHDRVPWLAVVALYLLGRVGVVGAQGETAPSWAYPICAPVAHDTPRLADAARSVEPLSPRTLHVPGSALEVSEADIKRWSVTVDWFPTEHAPLPAILAMSHSPDKPACGFCHLPDGSGRPENAKVAGLPAAYILAQVKALRVGARQAAVAGWLPTTLMQSATADLSEAELMAAAEYFAGQRVKSFVTVKESSEVPAHAAVCYVSTAATAAAPLGATIFEMPLDLQRFEARDPHTPYVAYVPLGSVGRGRRLAQDDTGPTQPCTVCHGSDLRSGDNLPGPPLAGRFPTYVFRQLVGFKLDARGGDAAPLMQAVVARLTQSEMVDLSAYVASLPP